MVKLNLLGCTIAPRFVNCGIVTNFHEL